MEKLKKILNYKLEFVLFIVDAIYMILELIASRLLSPYFGSSNVVWTSIIGIILLSNSVGNYFGGKIADKNGSKKTLKTILAVAGLIVLIIPLIQSYIISSVSTIIPDIKIGAIISTIILFFIPSMILGLFSPIVIKIKMENIENAGKTSGKIYAIATLGSLFGTFLGGFYLIPTFGSNQILFVLSITLFLLILVVGDINIKKKIDKVIAFVIVAVVISMGCFTLYYKNNEKMGEKVLNNEFGSMVSYDTQYGRACIYNINDGENPYRVLLIDRGNESATYINAEHVNDLKFEYTKYYDLMFKSQNEIKDVLMIGGAGYSYPKYFISNYLDKNIDVVEIDEKVTQLAKKYFYLDKLIEDYDLENTNRLGLITQDGRIYINQSEKKYDAILNDAFSGYSPAETLTTIEAAQNIYKRLNENGMYLTNIISSMDGENSKFIKAEVNTLKQVFKNVYIVNCNYKQNRIATQNSMIIATDQDLEIEDSIEIEYENSIILTDDYCPIDALIPKV